jgi:hypothetical protein
MYQVYSLIDITKTDQHRHRSQDRQAVDQQSNYSVFEQCLMLRSNVILHSRPMVMLKDVKEFGFGSRYQGQHQIWFLEFDTEQSDYVTVAQLQEDFNMVPMISNLKESININNNIFITKDPQNTNIVFYKNSTL